MEIEIRSSDEKHLVTFYGVLAQSVIDFISDNDNFVPFLISNGRKVFHGFKVKKSDGFKNELFLVMVNPGDYIFIRNR